ncbi:MAG: alpha/beta hydrolase fold domain-containing protein [Actinomycetota bacterium]
MTTDANGTTTGAAETDVDVDVVVAGAGFAGMYLAYKLRELGFSMQGFETADDVGGTWYWNRYPGARCDIESIDYSYSFDPELETEWEWSEKYATQPEILRYADHVATKHDLRKHFRFQTRVAAATWEDDASRWRLTTDGGDELTCRHYVMATGCLSQPKLPPDIAGIESFAGDTYYTSQWPHEGVDFTGKRVGVVGTGSSGIQSIPIIAEQAAELTVFQRTPNFSMPARNGDIRSEKRDAIDGRHAEYRNDARWSRAGVPIDPPEEGAFQLDPEERKRRLEAGWQEGTLFGLSRAFNDAAVNPAANEIVADFIRDKIREIVDDPAVAEDLCPDDHPFGTKRPCLDSGYYTTFNKPGVSLVNLRKDPIRSVTATGIDTESRSFDFDALVFATGFDAMTGAIVAVDIEGRDGLTLKQKWADGPLTYLGLMVDGFPNFYAITGPGSPSVLSNMMVSIEQHVEWIAATLADLRDNGLGVIEPTPTAEAGWVQHVNDCADITLYPQANSWYMGANVPGKPRVFLPYIGGVDAYRQVCDDVVEQGYLGFELGPADGSGAVTQRNDGIIRRVQPDVAMVLDMMAELDLPPIESMDPASARAFMEASSAERPPGPEVGEIVDGTYPAADGELEYRLYRPPTDGPHPLVLYFHGGGWVLGAHDSDDPMCRDLCVASDSIILSCNYRHGPEARFPAAPDDAFAALRWAAANAEALGARPGPLVVCGWSAGGNLATVVTQQARDAGGPAIAGQVLITPVTDCVLEGGSYDENAEGFVLTTGLMRWFWSHYADEAERSDPRASPIRGNLDDLPPAVVFTAQFDPLRNEGAAYVEALQAAGNEASHVPMRGQMHTSLSMVDILISAVPERAQVAAALREMAARSVAAT